MLSDPIYRAEVIRRVKDDALRNFWVNEFDRRDKRSQAEAMSPILNRIGKLFLVPPTRNIFGQTRGKIIDRGRIFIANLSKGSLGRLS